MTRKTTVYLPDDVKAMVEGEARRLGISEAEFIRQAIAKMAKRPQPMAGIVEGEPFADRAEDLLDGFGER